MGLASTWNLGKDAMETATTNIKELITHLLIDDEQKSKKLQSLGSGRAVRVRVRGWGWVAIDLKLG